MRGSQFVDSALDSVGNAQDPGDLQSLSTRILAFWEKDRLEVRQSPGHEVDLHLRPRLRSLKSPPKQI